jgi:pyruvate dehydrogenase E2 component (dihydrolipoamide acetyltransferase)
MAHNVIMPKTGMAMEEGTIVRWLKAVGDAVTRGEAIAVIETDKVTMDLESDFEGTLLAIVHGDGTAVKATETIAWIGTPGEKVLRTTAAAPAAAIEKAPGAAVAAPVKRENVPATPAARARAAEKGVSLSSVAGTGPGGAVRVKDLQGAAARATQAASAPSATMVIRADVTELESFLTRLNAAGGAPLTIAELVVKAAALALREHPLVNSVTDGDRIVVRDDVNIGVAVALEAGLIVPVIRGADRMTLRGLSAACQDLGRKARAGTLTAQECSGGTFTVTDLGMYGITEFTPIISVPETAVLGAGAIEEGLRTGPSGIESRKIMSLCLTHDQRFIDGAPAAAFLGRIRFLLENCYSLIA